jgi:hypothetical protein
MLLWKWNCPEASIPLAEWFSEAQPEKRDGDWILVVNENRDKRRYITDTGNAGNNRSNNVCDCALCEQDPRFNRKLRKRNSSIGIDNGWNDAVEKVFVEVNMHVPQFSEKRARFCERCATKLQDEWQWNLYHKWILRRNRNWIMVLQWYDCIFTMQLLANFAGTDHSPEVPQTGRIAS